MTYIFAHPFIFDIQIALTLYDNWKQTTRRSFLLRNLHGASEAEQIAHAQQILDNIAAELHFLTRYGVDKGVIRVNGKKVSETMYLYRPHEKAQHFRYGVKLTFSQLYAYYWTKTSEGRRHRSWRLYEEKWDEKWQRQVLGYSKVKSLRLPCMVNVRDEPSLFFQHHGVLKRGRKVKGWLVHFDRKDTIYQRFVSRFFEDGNLSFGGQRFWSTDNSLVQVIGVKWSPPKIRSASVSRKSQLASQPRDDTDYVYLIRMGHSLIFKIGKSNDPQGRLANLQTANPYKLKMVHLFRADNASAAEEMLHGYFHEKRKEGEWFRLTQVEKELLLKVSQFEQGCFVVEGVRLSIKDLFGDHRNNT